jgi:hypothetical protein
MLFYLTLILGAEGQEIFEQQNDDFVRSLDQSYLRGLLFLQNSQTEDGIWIDSSYGSEPGVLGMAVLAFLSRGDDPEFGPFSKPLARSIEQILRLQNKETGYIGNSMYNHGFATLALAEYYGLTNNTDIGPALKKATNLIVSAQKTNPKGAWRYSPESKDADTTITGAQLVALFASKNAGIEVPDEAIAKGKQFLIDCQDEKGGFGYTGNSGANLPRTAIGSLILALDKDTDSKPFKSSLEYLRENARFGDQGHKFYSLYYTAQAMFRASPEDWNTWNLANVRQLQATQSESGSWTGNYGTTFATSAALLSMALNYRYLPIYER